MNILNKPFTGPHNSAMFSAIKNTDFLPAITLEIENTKKQIQAIIDTKEAPTFKNTIAALEFSGMQLDSITSVFFNLNAAHTNEEIQKIAQEISPLLTDFSNDIRLNKALFLRVKAVYEQRETLALSPEQSMLLEKKYKSFARNGANLEPEKQEQLREFDKKLASLSLQFGENVLAQTHAFSLEITDKKDLEGLPEGAIETAKALAEQKQKQGWIFTLDYPSYIPFMTYAKNRSLREKMHTAFGSRSFNSDTNDNQNIILEIVNLRHKRAQLLGYASHSDFILEERMAKSPKTVLDFSYDLLEKATPAAKKEFATLSAFAKQKDGITELQKWDSAYYSELLKKERFNLDDELLKPYFKLENVVNGAFTIAEKLFGITLKKTDAIDVYHKEVSTYEVYDANGDFLAVFYTDFHPRKGKRNGAWMTSYKPQYRLEGKQERPHVSIVCNFTKPTPTKPSLLTFNEVTTLFHEFGHALHGILANTTYPSLSGTNVSWDFVELPSQILENWCFEKEALSLFARHYKTDAVIPMEYIEKIKASASFHEGMQTLRQLSFGLLDMAWHSQDPSHIKDVQDFENKAFEKTNLYPKTPNTCMSTAFSHIFQGGYSSGYYSYKWAEVLDADAFALFQEKGIFNTEVAKAFKDTVLSQGGTQDPMDLYIQFRGQKPNAEALLKRAGLL